MQFLFAMIIGLINYLNESIMVVTERVQFSSAEIKQSLTIGIDNIVTLALFQVNKVKDLNNVNMIIAFTFEDS